MEPGCGQMGNPRFKRTIIMKKMKSTGPNILLLHCHDLGRHLGCYGNKVETPNIDSRAEEGLRFDKCFSTAPMCVPSRDNRITGLYPTNNRSIGRHDEFRIREDIKALATYLTRGRLRNVSSGHESRGGKFATKGKHALPRIRCRGCFRLTGEP